MHAAVHNGAQALQEVAVHRPFVAVALLVEVHPHYQRFAQLLRQLHKTRPRRVMAQDVPYHQLLPRPAGSRYHALRAGNRIRQGLLYKHMAPAFQRHDGKTFMRIGVRGNTYRIRPGGGQRFFIAAVQRISAAQPIIQYGFAGAG